MHNAETLISSIQGERFTSLFPRLYGTDCDIDFQVNRYRLLIEKHLKLYTSISKDTPIRLYSTSGRTELAGNHTDHNLGKVIAASINLDTIAAAHTTDDHIATVVSEGFPVVSVDLSDLDRHPAEAGTTQALLRGIAAGFVKRGLKVGGFEANTSTRVLKGSGLSSSAAIEVLCATLFNDLYNQNTLPPVELAIIGKFAENVYFGKPSGLMDQIACGEGGIVGIDFANPDNPVLSPLDYSFQKAGYDLVVVDTGGNHADLTPDYASIPKEMRAVAACFDKDAMREVPFGEFMDALPALRKRLGNDRALLRAYHFLAENERVDAMLNALVRNDVSRYLQLVRESGDSSFKYLQNVYSNISLQEQGLPLALAITERFLNGEGACRVHGGGFAGTIQVYVPLGRTREYLRVIGQVFGGNAATVLAIRSLPTTRLL
ncbi:MAG: galactokinase [Sphaerochaetaceae bacterium]